MNITEARAALRSSARKELLLAHLLAAIGTDDDVELGTLINIHGTLVKLPRSTVMDQIRSLVAEGYIDVSDGVLPSTSVTHFQGEYEPCLQIGRSFNHSLEPQLEPVARWLIDKAHGDSGAHAKWKPGARHSAAQITDRRNFIRDYLNSKTTSFSVDELAKTLRGDPEFAIFLPKSSPIRRKKSAPVIRDPGGNAKSAPPRKTTSEHIAMQSLKRLLLRDLQVLLQAGEVKRDGTRYEASRVGKLTELIKPVALLMLKRLTEGVLPEQIKEPLEKVFANAQEQLERHSASVSQDVRWLNAFRIVPARPELDEPLIKPEVIKGVHTAILERSKVEIKAIVNRYDAGGSVVERRVFKATGSISHFLLEMPNRMAIEFWPEGAEESIRISLEDVTHIRQTTAHATWPGRDCEPESIPSLRTLVAGDASGEESQGTKFVLRVSSLALEHFKARRIGKIIQVTEDDDGWYLVSFRARASISFLTYLRGLNEVTILRPAAASFYSRYHLFMKSAGYKASHDLALQLRLEERREEGEPEEYLEALSQSPEWRECPTLIEYMVSTLFLANPYGFEVDEVPCHVEQWRYLAVATDIYRYLITLPPSRETVLKDEEISNQNLPSDVPSSALPGAIRSHGDFARVLRHFVESHEFGRKAQCNWDHIADQLWDALNDLAIYRNPHPVY